MLGNLVPGMLCIKEAGNPQLITSWIVHVEGNLILNIGIMNLPLPPLIQLPSI